MQLVAPKKVFVVMFVIAVLIIGVFAYVALQTKPEPEPISFENQAMPTVIHSIIGSSLQEREIEAFTFGKGETKLLFVGGVHGGYEKNSIDLARAFVDYFTKQPNVIPEHITVSIIPSANPDGLSKEIGPAGRFNANGVDLNRNFDCKWQPTSMWKGMEVSAGSEPFSEPETRALRDFIQGYNPSAVIFWHSKAGAVYASECEEGILPETLSLMSVYAKAAEYGAVKSFDSYEITGDAEGWLASIGIPAITVELETHEAIDWEQNLAGVQALFTYYDTLED
jgi:predicted deacylase